MIKSQSINNSNDFYNISNQSSNSKKLEYSTPKFLPHKNGTIKDSSKTK